MVDNGLWLCNLIEIVQVIPIGEQKVIRQQLDLGRNLDIVLGMIIQ